MAWSAKLQSGSGGTQGVNEWEMVYDAATQTELKLKYNFGLGDEAPDVLYHSPDNGAPIPVRANGRNRLIFLGFHIPTQSDWDSVLNVLTPLSRLVDGPDSQAIRAQINGDVDTVRVAIKPDGATYTTYYDVLEGFIDASDAFTSPAAVQNTMAYNVTLALTCKPYGYGDSFTLANELPSSAHFLEDGNSDNLADGWNKGGTPTVGFSTTYYLSGGQSQFFNTSSSGAGIYSDNVSVGNGVDMVASCWITVRDVGSALVRLRNTSDSSTLDSAILQPSDAGGVSDKSIVGAGGLTWYRVVLSGTNSTGSAKNYSLQILANAAASTICNIDNAYFESGTTTALPAFASTKTIYNRYDPANDTRYINYIDTWGIPGDVPADIIISYDKNNSAKDSLIVCSITDGTALAADFPFWHDDTDYGAGAFTASNWSQTTDTARTNDSYMSCGGGGAQLDTIIHQFTAAQSRYLARYAVRVFAIHYGASTAASLQASLVSGGSHITGDAVTRTVATTWGLSDLGLFNLVGTAATNSGNEEVSFYLNSGGSATSRVDAIIFLPGSAENIAYTPYRDTTDDALIIFDSSDNSVEMKTADAIYGTAFSYSKNAAAGNVPRLMPGIMTRLLFISYADHSASDPEEHAITDNPTVTLTVTPRTQHLLGTK
jgi:hypothetical protein